MDKFRKSMSDKFKAVFGENVRNRDIRSVLLLVLLVMVIIYTTWLRDLPYFHNQDHDILELNDLSRSPVMISGKMFNKTATKHCTIYDLSMPIGDKFNCVQMKIEPPTTVCLYSEFRDKYVSHDLQHTGMWEPHVLNDFKEALLHDETLGVIDIGANIGVYSLLAARMGRKVVAVEPFSENLERVHKAAALSGVEGSIVLLKNAVTDVRGEATIRQNGDNQGDTRIKQGSEPCIGSCPKTVQTILLDDLLEVLSFNRSIIKIDVQGYEHKTFRHSQKLLDEIFIPYIFMEWLEMKTHFKMSNHTSMDKDLVHNTMKVLMGKRYRPYALDANGARKLSLKSWQSWPNDIVWRLLPTDRDITRLLRNHFFIWP